MVKTEHSKFQSFFRRQEKVDVSGQNILVCNGMCLEVSNYVMLKRREPRAEKMQLPFIINGPFAVQLAVQFFKVELHF